jgi:hypothetical protein
VTTKRMRPPSVLDLDMLRRSARCGQCRGKGAVIQLPDGVDWRRRFVVGRGQHVVSPRSK